MTDLVHDLHAELFKAATKLLEDLFQNDILNRKQWIQHNLYFGYVLSLVSFFAILYMLAKELWRSVTASSIVQIFSQKRFLSEFAISHGHIWSLAILTTMPIVLWGQKFDYFL